jgi:hypothetical protein
MDIYDEEFLTFWKELNALEVRYIMVGGIATNLHGYQRTTDDVDVWIEDTQQNRRAFRKALKAYSGTDYFMIDTLQIVPGWTYFHLNNGVRLDLMTEMKGLESFSFDDCLKVAVVADIDGVLVPFLHINHLIDNKKSVNRPKDQVDVIYLEKIKKIQEEENP